jgi:hypothetical protein
MLEKKIVLDSIVVRLNTPPVIELQRTEQIYEDGQPYGTGIQLPVVRYLPGSLSETEQAELDAVLGEVVTAQQDALHRVAAVTPADAPVLTEAERHAFEVQIQQLQSDLEHRDAALVLLEQELRDAQAALPSDVRLPMSITPS